MSDERERYMQDAARRAAGAQAIRDEEEGKAKKIFKSAWAWLTTDDNDELLGKLDQELGTDFQSARKQGANAVRRMAKHVRDEGEGETRVHADDRISRQAPPDPPGPGERPAPGPHSMPVQGTHSMSAGGPVVIVKKRAACTTCNGFGALELDEATNRTRPIPCPACGRMPAASQA